LKRGKIWWRVSPTAPVLCDTEVLKTLPVREFRAGLAEVIKYGIIYDAALFARLESDLPKSMKR